MIIVYIIFVLFLGVILGDRRGYVIIVFFSCSILGGNVVLLCFFVVGMDIVYVWKVEV